MPSRVFAVPHGGKPPLEAAVNFGRRSCSHHHAFLVPSVDGRGRRDSMNTMKATFTALIDNAPEGGYWAVCPVIPGANGQGETIEEAGDSLRNAIQLILEDRVEG